LAPLENLSGPVRDCYETLTTPYMIRLDLLARSIEPYGKRRLNNHKPAASYRFRGAGFSGVRLRERGFGRSSFIWPILKGCFFTVFLRTLVPSVGPLDEREMLLPVSDLPPPLALPLLAGLTMATDWTGAWQYGHLVVLTGKISRRNAAKHIALVQSFIILFAITMASPGKFTSILAAKGKTL